MFLDWKNQYCEKDYTTQAIYRLNATLIKLPKPFSQNQNKKFYSLYGKQKTSQSNLEIEKMELEESTFLTLDETGRLQSSRQYGTGTKTEIHTNETIQKAWGQIHAPMGTLSLTKETKIYDGEKTASSQ